MVFEHKSVSEFVHYLIFSGGIEKGGTWLSFFLSMNNIIFIKKFIITGGDQLVLHISLFMSIY
jgi:hypothetical protein